MRQNKAMSLLAITALVSTLLMITSVVALGIGPAKTSIDYIGPETRDVTFNIFRERSEPYEVRLEKDGVLAPYITLDSSEILLSQDLVPIPFTLRIPEGLPPGPNEGRIIVTEVAGTVYGGQSVGVTSIRIPHKIIINMPYPDKYVMAEVNVKSDEDKVQLTSIVKNIGSLPLANVKADYEIHERERSIAVLSTQSTALEPLAAGSIGAEIERSRLPNGEYEAATTIHFDDLSIELVKAFEVGEPTIILTNFDHYFEPEEINPFAFEVYNDWNADVSDISMDIAISHPEKGPVTTLKTFTFVLKPRETKKIETYWDTRGLAEGDYDATITLYIGPRKVSKPVALSIRKGAKREMASAEDSSDFSEYLLILAMALIAITLLGVIIVLIMVVRKRP